MHIHEIDLFKQQILWNFDEFFLECKQGGKDWADENVEVDKDDNDNDDDIVIELVQVVITEIFGLRWKKWLLSSCLYRNRWGRGAGGSLGMWWPTILELGNTVF